MKNFLLLMMVVIMNNTALADKRISNLVTPVSYFVNHVKQISELKNNLSKYGKSSLIGTSGIGKTQLARTFAYESKDKYHLIWFFDCNLDINAEFVKLAKQLNQIDRASISMDAKLAKKEAMEYLTNKKEWLLVFDNLKIGDNKKVRDIVDWEHNGNVVFCSQEVEILPHIIKLTKFKTEDAITLANNILENEDRASAKFLAESFKGYPILIVGGAQLLNQVKGLDKEEYQKKIYESADKIKLNIVLATEKLTPSARKLLDAVALINNQNFSKQMLYIITDSTDSLDDDIYQLSKFALISNIHATQDNPIYEMHDVISQKILEINGDNSNRKALEDIITKFMNSIPKSAIKGQVFRDAVTVRENLDIITKNAQKYNINIYRLLELNMERITEYSNTADLYNAKILVDWFNKNEEEGNFKLWLMNNNEKGSYARYLASIAWYCRKGSDPRKAIDYYIRALEIYKTVTGFESFKCNTYFGLAMANILLGNVIEAEKNIEIMQQMFDKNLVEKTDMGTMLNAKSKLYFIQGKYREALEYNDKTIAIILESGAKVNDLLFTHLYIFRADILNTLGRYEEARVMVEQLLDMHKLSNKRNSDIFGRIYTQLSKNELGLGAIDKAYAHIKEAIDLFVTDKSRSFNTTGISEDPDLASSYIVQGDILFTLGKLKESIESYRDAERIYFYLYKDNKNKVAQVSYLYLQGAKASCKAKDMYHYKCFGEPQVKEFGKEHPNTVSMFEYCKNYNMDSWKEES